MSKFLMSLAGGGIGNTLSNFVISYAYNKYVHQGRYILYAPLDFSNQCNFMLDFFKPIDGVSYLKNIENFNPTLKAGVEAHDDYAYDLTSTQVFGGRDSTVVWRRETNEDEFIHMFNTRQSFLEENIATLFSDFPHALPVEYKAEAINLLRLKHSIRQRVEHFCKQHSISKDTFGAHIRATDAARFYHPPLDKLYELCDRAVAENKKVFLCSDDPSVEKELARRYSSTVITTAKNFPPRRLNEEEEWTSPVELTRKNGEKFLVNYNVQYSPACVLEGIIDFFLLVRTNFELQSWGTYGDWAKFFSEHYRWEEK